MQAIQGAYTRAWLSANLRRSDTVHLHWPSFLYSSPQTGPTARSIARYLALLASIRGRGAAPVWTAHNLLPHDSGRARLAHKVVRHATIRLSRAVFAHGPSAARIIAQGFPEASGKLHVIPHGHWVGYYKNQISRTEARARLDLGNEFTYLFLGQCRPYKDLLTLISAFSRQTGAIRLIIAGQFKSATYRAEVERAANGDSRIRVVDCHVPDDDLQVYLNAADCMVLPYVESLTSGACVLAMSFGLPVVAPAVGSLCDLLTASTGVAYDRRNPDGLVDAMRTAQARQFSRETVRGFVERYGFDLAAGKLAAVAREHALGYR
ncbi:MAG: glycosyltransferase family 4 protein [Pseudomonadota bacterium]